VAGVGSVATGAGSVATGAGSVATGAGSVATGAGSVAGVGAGSVVSVGEASVATGVGSTVAVVSATPVGSTVAGGSAAGLEVDSEVGVSLLVVDVGAASPVVGGLVAAVSATDVVASELGELVASAVGEEGSGPSDPNAIATGATATVRTQADKNATPASHAWRGPGLRECCAPLGLNSLERDDPTLRDGDNRRSPPGRNNY
jgi:hypothetical protein